MAMSQADMIAKGTLDILQEDTTKSWNLSPLVDAVAVRTGQKNKARIGLVIRSLVYTKRLQGYINGRQCSSIRYKLAPEDVKAVEST